MTRSEIARTLSGGGSAASGFPLPGPGSRQEKSIPLTDTQKAAGALAPPSRPRTGPGNARTPGLRARGITLLLETREP
jgi:hypothetical protein